MLSFFQSFGRFGIPLAFFSLLFGLPGYLDDAKTWEQWMDALTEGWAWWRYVLLALACISLVWAATPVPDLDKLDQFFSKSKGGRWWRYALCVLIPFAAYFWFRESPLHEMKNPPATQEEIIEWMQTFQGYVEDWDNPHGPTFRTHKVYDAGVLAKKLTELKLAPPKGYSVRINAQGKREENIGSINQWRHYLRVILPVMKREGIARAREETQTWPEDWPGPSH